MADTIGAAWAVSHLIQGGAVIENGKQHAAILNLPPIALRLDPEILERLIKLGLRQVKDFIGMPRTALRRRFGKQLLQRVDQALGQEEEPMELLHPGEIFHERLPCLEPIVTAGGIEIALKSLLESLCQRLQQEEKGLRVAGLKCYRVDGKIETVTIHTNRPSHNTQHLFKLFEFKVTGIEPALGIELFILEAPVTEDIAPLQSVLWENRNGLDNNSLAELLDRITGKIGASRINRYLPAEHYWPERSFRAAAELQEEPSTTWNAGRPRPLQLLSTPQLIEVTAPIPDYPPMLFRLKGSLHKIVKADGPERIEQEWWLQEGEHRDYYIVEDEQGCRYWVFRSGHYDAGKSYQWYLHGFFS
jgi:protein ImuB